MPKKCSCKKNNDKKFVTSFMLLAGMMIFTYIVAPDLQASWTAIATGVDSTMIINLWIVSLVGIAMFLIALYKVRQLP